MKKLVLISSALVIALSVLLINGNSAFAQNKPDKEVKQDVKKDKKDIKKDKKDIKKDKKDLKKDEKQVKKTPTT